MAETSETENAIRAICGADEEMEDGELTADETVTFCTKEILDFVHDMFIQHPLERISDVALTPPAVTERVSLRARTVRINYDDDVGRYADDEIGVPVEYEVVSGDEYNDGDTGVIDITNDKDERVMLLDELRSLTSLDERLTVMAAGHFSSVKNILQSLTVKRMLVCYIVCSLFLVLM